jgi:hypothetical protein
MTTFLFGLALGFSASVFSNHAFAWMDEQFIFKGESLRKPASVAPSYFRCSKFTAPDRQVLKPSSCDDTGGFGLLDERSLSRPELRTIFGSTQEKDLEHQLELRNLALETKFTLTSNMNAAVFTFPNGVSRTVFRGSYQAPQFFKGGILKKRFFESDQKVACMKSLVKDHALSKIVNYDEIDWESAQRLTRAEKDLFLGLNPQAQYWMYNEQHLKPDGTPDTFQYKFKYGKEKVFDQVASIVNEIAGDVSQPGSAYIHCYGGHHRTGVVWGVLQKCMGQDHQGKPMDVDDIVKEYQCHIGYESPERPGGYHKDNEALIREFPCEKYWPKK